MNKIKSIKLFFQKVKKKKEKIFLKIYIHIYKYNFKFLSNKILEKIRILKYKSLDSYINSDLKIEVIIDRKKKISYIEPKFKLSDNKKKIEKNYGREIVFKAKDVEIMGGSNLFIFNDEALYMIKDEDKKRRIKYTDENILDFIENKELFISYNNENVQKIEEGIYIGGNYTYNYYHFLIEFISKYKLIYEAKIDSQIPLLVDEINIKIPQFKYLIEKFNCENRKIIPIKNKEYNRIKALYICKTANLIPPNLKDGIELGPEDTLFDISTLVFLRNVLLDNIKIDKKLPSRIFLSRKNASNRRRFNEKEVEKYLSTLGFYTIYPEELSIEEQISIFYNAKIIIGGGGAAFTNLLFCQKETIAILLTNYSIKTSLFSILAEVSGCNLLYVVDDKLINEKPDDIHKEFEINIDKLSKIIKEIEERYDR